MPTWTVHQRRATAAELAGGWPLPAGPDHPTVAVCQPTDAAVVLGSTQPDAVVDADRAARAGLAVARRRSGGGAVLVTPDDPVWVDAWVPRGHQLSDDDVARAFEWLGTAWAAALGVVGVTGATVHRGRYDACTRWCSLVCFGGVGSGEVVGPDGRKVVGLAQRRTRDGAWFHGACYRRWEPAALLDVLVLTDADRAAAADELAGAAAGVADGGGAGDGPALVDALLAALP